MASEGAGLSPRRARARKPASVKGSAVSSSGMSMGGDHSTARRFPMPPPVKPLEAETMYGHRDPDHVGGSAARQPRALTRYRVLLSSAIWRLAAAALSLRKGRERGQTSARKCTSVPVSASSFKP